MCVCVRKDDKKCKEVDCKFVIDALMVDRDDTLSPPENIHVPSEHSISPGT